MPFIEYEKYFFRKQAKQIIDTANSIIAEYQTAGYDLTLRQLYYQFVARGIIPNKDTEYDKLGCIINNARLAGLIDWDAITDRTRPSRGNAHWDSPQEYFESATRRFRIDTRATQPNYIECWVEKDALIGVLEKICISLDVSYFACRGYVSQSAMWEAAQRFIQQEEYGRETYLIHLGDHDPSGIDMSRDIQERLKLFHSNCQVNRIALTMEQIEIYNPPPNPAKLTDSRCQSYIHRYGNSSWELDALDPKTISELIERAISKLTVEQNRQVLIDKQAEYKAEMLNVCHNWDKVEVFVQNL
jgi:hypothetical protein